MVNKELKNTSDILRFLNPYFTEKKFRILNKAVKLIQGMHSKKIKYDNIYLNRGDGSKLRVCVYYPIEKRENVPGILWIHGGGYAFGTPEQDEVYIKRFIDKSGCVVVSPDYRLSTENPYPAALIDCYRALVWLKKNGSKYGMRQDQIMIGGTSAGGGLTIAVSLYAKDRKKVSLAYQMPIYPMIDDRMETASSINNESAVWNTKSNKIAWKLYLGELFGRKEIPSYAAPARATDLTGLPPTCSFVGSLDPFRDETIEMMKKLKASGVEVNYKVFKGCFHGFDIICPGASISKEATKFLMDNFEYAVKNYFSPQSE